MNRDDTPDNELLKLAGKAVGGIEQDGAFFYCRNQHKDICPWNPLTDDGDALRLAVQLGMLFTYMHERFELFQRFYREELDKDRRPSEATRRAIVRTAAQIGKEMQP